MLNKYTIVRLLIYLLKNKFSSSNFKIQNFELGFYKIEWIDRKNIGGVQVVHAECVVYPIRRFTTAN